MIVVDVGCHPQGPEESVYKLVRRFSPDVLFGFDPFPHLKEGVEFHFEADVATTMIVRRRAAAWLHGKGVTIAVNGICTGVAGAPDAPFEEALRPVPSVDLVAFLAALPDPVVLKLDAEGAEYPLLAALAVSGIDSRLERVLVEWHPPETAHGFYRDERPELACPVEEWE
jgi:hypothetical protein